MDDGKRNPKSQMDGKENSSSNGDHTSENVSESEGFVRANQESDPVRILQLSQPFFVADTLEDDESLISPSQDDSVPFMVPSTPCIDKSEEQLQKFNPKEATVSILEETCVDLENKPEHNKMSKEDITKTSNTTYNESDLTQDLSELDATQQILSSEDSSQLFVKDKNDTRGKEDEDDDWQLKFSETQTQEILQFQGTGCKEEESKEEIPVKHANEYKIEEDLPATLTISIKESPEKERKTSTNDGSIKMIPRNEDIEVQILSDDEVEPSQSYLSEYKGETISTSFKMSSNTPTNESSIGEFSHHATELNSNPTNEETEKLMKSTILNKDTEKHIILKSDTVNITTAQDSRNDKMQCDDFNNSKNINTLVTTNVDAINLDKHTEEKSCITPLAKVCDVEITKEDEPKRDYAKKRKKDEEALVETIIDKDIKVKQIQESKLECLNIEKGAKIKLGKDNIENSIDRMNESKISRDSLNDNVVIEGEENLKDVKYDEHDVKAIEVEKSEISFTKDKEKSTNKDISKIIKPENNSRKEVNKEVDWKTDFQTNKTFESSLAKSGDYPQGKKENLEDKTETPPIFKPPMFLERGHGSVRKQKYENKIIYHNTSPVEKSDRRVILETCNNIKSLDRWFKSIGITLEHQKLEAIFSKTNEEIKVKPTFSILDHKITLEDILIEVDQHRQAFGISSISSSSTTTSSTLSLKSGELADTSSSSSAKSCGTQIESIGQSMHLTSSQDAGLEVYPKTSTQKTDEPTVFSEMFGKNLEKSKTDDHISPIKSASVKSTKKTSVKRKKGSQKNIETSSSEASSPVSKRKRDRTVKVKAPIIETNEEAQESNIDVALELNQLRKGIRRKKDDTCVSDKIPGEIKTNTEHFKLPFDDDMENSQEEANFGSILPGVKVMARWTDGYYYSGMVQSQEMGGRWSVLFEDGFLRSIAPESLIKIAILPKGTSVLVQSPDDFYDPGIVCGHFREGSKVGYEVELDNGVTKRYPRSSVILSGDQAKLLTSNRPPTTPPTMTINLDNIIDGKRKRKSVQSSVTSPVLTKKSPRITRSKKPDPNLDSTAESSSTERTISLKVNQIEEIKKILNEKPTKKKRKGRATTKKANTISATTTDVIDNSNTKATKVLPQRSAKNTKSLFKDYAFLLTNADRKIIPKPVDTSDSEGHKIEEEDIVPFDKDELCNCISQGGGMILEKFDDIKKCNRKHIYLLANSYLRTMKYIQCLAAGISCIKHHWVQNCIFKGEIFNINSYILQSGFSLVKQQVIEWHGRTNVFKGLKIALVSAPESPFVFTWAPVLLAAKAEFVQKWSLPSSVSGCSPFVDVLITNNHCPYDIIQSAKKRKIPIVSSEWIIQCLITGRVLPYDAHPKFQYDFTEM